MITNRIAALLCAGLLLVACGDSGGGGTDAGTDAGADAGPAPDAGGVCGDGVLDPGEGCDDGNLVAADGCSAACETYPEQAAFDALVDGLDADALTDGVPGAAIAVVVDGELRYTAGVGVRAVGQPERVTSETLFALASVTKMFTGAAALSLAEDGVVDLQAPIGDYLPIFGLQPPHDATAVTLHGLLSHTAGYPNLMTLDAGDGIDYSHPDCLVDFFAYYTDVPLWFAPGALWSYSNNGYLLAGAVLQAAAGEPFADLVTTRILRPAGMDRATFSDVESWNATDHAWGHDLGAGGTLVLWQPLGERYTYEPMGGLYASVRDLGQFLVAVLADDGRFLEPDSLVSWVAPHSPTGMTGQTYGYGVEADLRQGGELLLGHGGGQSGFRAQMFWAPSEGFGVVVVQNASFGFAYWSAADAAVEAFTSLSPRPPPVSTGPADWAAYEGSYVDPHFWGPVTFAVVGGTLQATFTDVPNTVSCIQYDGHYWGCPAPTATHHGEPLGSMIYGTFWLDAQAQGAYFSTRYGVATRQP